MSDAEDQHHEAIVFDLANEPVGAYAVPPKLPETGTDQGSTEAARIVQLGYSLMQEFQDAPRVLRVNFLEFAVSLGR